MVSYFIVLYFVLWLAIRPVGQSHERRPGGQLREEALQGDEEDKGINGGQPRE